MPADSSQIIQFHLPKGTAAQRESVPQASVSLTDLIPAQAFDGSATGFLLASLPESTAPILWVQDRLSRSENGAIYLPGLKSAGLDRPVLQVRVNHPRDVLWVMEEAASCAALSAVVGEVHGGPAVLDFTASKRLALRGEASGVPIFLIRAADPGGLSAARARWRITSLPSEAHPHNPQAPGAARWDADLFRARGRAPGRWVASYDDRPAQTHRLRLLPRLHGGALDTGDQPVPHTAG